MQLQQKLCNLPMYFICSAAEFALDGHCHNCVCIACGSNGAPALLQGVDVKGQRVSFTDDSGKKVTVGYDLLVGADGVNSTVRYVSGHHTLRDART